MPSRSSSSPDSFTFTRPAVVRPLLMGVLNVTPDSFSDGGQHATTAAAIAHDRGMAGIDRDDEAGSGETLDHR